MNDKELILAGVDVEDLLARFMNNRTLMKMIVGKFIQEGTFAQLKDAVDRGDAKAAEFACHSLKGICGNMSLNRLFIQLQEQLRLFRAGDFAGAAAKMPQIAEDYESAIRHLQLWMSQE